MTPSSLWYCCGSKEQDIPSKAVLEHRNHLHHARALCSRREAHRSTVLSRTPSAQIFHAFPSCGACNGDMLQSLVIPSSVHVTKGDAGPLHIMSCTSSDSSTDFGASIFFVIPRREWWWKTFPFRFQHFVGDELAVDPALLQELMFRVGAGEILCLNSWFKWALDIIGGSPLRRRLLD